MSHSGQAIVESVDGGESRMALIRVMPCQHWLINVEAWPTPVRCFLF